MKLASILVASLVTCPSLVDAWLPKNGKIRGVNLASLFISEPWMDYGEWSRMGCNGQKSELGCVRSAGQARSDKAFQDHYANWINEQDLDEMKSYGLNTIRIPLGYWLKKDLVDSAKSEQFPKVRGLSTRSIPHADE